MTDSTYALSVTYGDGEPQKTEGLSAMQVEGGAGAFLRDMLYLSGSVVSKLVIEREPS